MDIISGDGDDEANAKVGRVNVSTDFIESFELSLVADSFIQLATYKSIATRRSVDEMSVRPHIRRTEEKKWRLINEQNSITFTIGLCPSLVSLFPFAVLLLLVVGVVYKETSTDRNTDQINPQRNDQMNWGE